jgi:hypothetical protein
MARLLAGPVVLEAQPSRHAVLRVLPGAATVDDARVQDLPTHEQNGQPDEDQGHALRRDEGHGPTWYGKSGYLDSNPVKQFNAPAVGCRN